MKRLLALLLSLVILSSVAYAEIPDLTTYSFEDLLQVWEQSGELLRQAGYYPYIELALRDSGDDVTALQKRLTELNYYSKPVTGEFDNSTETAFKEFEKSNGFKQDGKASIEEQKLIFSLSAIVKPTPSPKPTPTPKPTPRIATPQDIKSVASTNSVTISWASVKGAQKYNVYRSLSSDGSYTLLSAVTSTTYIDRTVTKGKAYYYKIESVSGDNISKLSNAKKVSVPTPSPTPDPRKAYGTFNYSNYFRYPENYSNDKFKIAGKVLQVLGTRSSGFDLRVATKGSYSDIVYITIGFDPGFNILKDDKLFLYCRGDGTHTYTSTMGASITLPLLVCDMLELRK